MAQGRHEKGNCATPGIKDPARKEKEGAPYKVFDVRPRQTPIGDILEEVIDVVITISRCRKPATMEQFMMTGGTSGLLSNIKSHTVSKDQGTKATYLEGVDNKSSHTAADTTGSIDPLTPEVEAIFASGVTEVFCQLVPIKWEDPEALFGGQGAAVTSGA